MQNYDIGKKIVNIEEQMNKRKQDIIQKDEDFMRWKARCEALKDRVDINKQYAAVLDKMESKLKDKPIKYDQQMKILEDSADDLAKNVQWAPVINVGKEANGSCFCMF